MISKRAQVPFIVGYRTWGVAFHATDANSLTGILSGIFHEILKIGRKKYDSFIQK